ncbi:MAG: hypothetical protein N838_31560 [Thiohalocapsa sp. PB-PSB1]|nr:MAG: hypothetical protein N838_31560 [Thiohalocapsa sp. PB-PSB1]
MTFWSMLTTKVDADAAASTIDVFVKRRCIEESAEKWLDSPLRAAQFPDLQGINASDLVTGMFETVHDVAKP